MRSLAGLLLAASLALGIAAGAVFGLGDRSVLTAPPEAVVEGFVRELASCRYDRALPYLDDRLKAAVSEAELRKATRRYVGTVGEIEDVRGDEGTLTKEAATASAALETRGSGWTRLPFHLRFSTGSWKIDGLPVELKAH